uniref:Uncharacterized protein n=1 Tax=Physcomitrium patens TaxID=3218 RepID=A0A2K1JQS9_PHYPA|nr:hypothetical protein PHYPA_016276 [Physcomitrium patens]
MVVKHKYTISYLNGAWRKIPSLNLFPTLLSSLFTQVNQSFCISIKSALGYL